ncbi:hypothetical protein ACXYX3_17855 [Mycobacterium sp. C3-094]
MKPTILIELLKMPGIRRFPGRKPEQPWRYLVSDAGNHEPFERPTERYSEERGALSAIEQVHGPDATVVLRREGHPDRVLRQPYPFPIGDTTIIGPQCFAANDGSVLNWEGRNYILQPDTPNLLDATETFMELAKQLETVGFPEPGSALRELRQKLLREEFDEYRVGEARSDLLEVVDGLLDVIVIAWGSLLAYVGPDKAKAAAAEVARSNLAKVIGEGLPLFREDGKVIKPEGWQPPDIAGAIA